MAREAAAAQLGQLPLVPAAAVDEFATLGEGAGWELAVAGSVVIFAFLLFLARRSSIGSVWLRAVHNRRRV